MHKDRQADLEVEVITSAALWSISATPLSCCMTAACAFPFISSVFSFPQAPLALLCSNSVRPNANVPPRALTTDQSQHMTGCLIEGERRVMNDVAVVGNSSTNYGTSSFEDLPGPMSVTATEQALESRFEWKTRAAKTAEWLPCTRCICKSVRPRASSPPAVLCPLGTWSRWSRHDVIYCAFTQNRSWVHQKAALNQKFTC